MALREVEITYSNGRKIGTNMAAHLTNKEIINYYKIGQRVNIGNADKDKMVSIKKVKIIR